MYTRKVVGFDVREMWIDIAAQWTRDQDALLRHGVLKPLSVDKYVWYSVFSELDESHLWQSVARKAKYSTPEWDNVFSESRKLTWPDSLPNGYRPRGVLVNLALLEDYIQKSWGDSWKPCYVVAIVEIIGDEDYEDEPSAFIISPDVVNDQWHLFGYDVADYSLTCGLFNLGLEPEETAKQRHEWESYLNENHLFIEPQKAFEYTAMANLKYPGHAPFFVYALYGVREVKVENSQNINE